MTVLFYSGVREYTLGERSFEAGEAENLRALIDLLGERYGAAFREFLLGDGTCFFLVNGNGIMTTGGLGTPLRAQDKVEVLPCVEGG